MTTAGWQEPVTLAVSNLPASTSFYSSALRPLGYHSAGQAQVRSAGALTRAIGFCSESTTRIDLILLEAEPSTGRRRGGRAHVVFPAPSRTIVRDFFHACLSAGGTPEILPALREGLFIAALADPDGNKIEVYFSDSSRDSQDEFASMNRLGSVSPDGKLIQAWRETTAKSVTSSYPYHPPPSTKTTLYPIPVSHASLPPSISRRDNGSTSRTSKTAPVATSRRQDVVDGQKKVIGTMLGVAAGAAVVYAMVKSHQDSRRQDEFQARMADRVRVKEEAKAYRQMNPSKDEDQCRRRDTLPTQRKSMVADRGSGYYSTASQYRESSPHKSMYRTVRYPLSRSTRNTGVLPMPANSISSHTAIRLPVRQTSVSYAAPPTQPLLETIPRRESYQSSKSPGHPTDLTPAPAVRRFSMSNDYTRQSFSPSDPRGWPQPAGHCRSYYPSQRNDRIYSKSSDPCHSGASMPLTESSLGAVLDDAETIVPDDSISCAPTKIHRSRTTPTRRPHRRGQLETAME